MRLKNLAAVKGLLMLGLCLDAGADVTITQLANEGVMLTSGDTRIMIDGMVVKPYSVYGGLDKEAAALFDEQGGVFSGVDLALVSHRHHDHNQPAAACRFMQASTGTLLETSGQVIGLMREKCRSFMVSSERVNEINPQYEAPVVLKAGEGTVRIFPLRPPRAAASCRASTRRSRTTGTWSNWAVSACCTWGMRPWIRRIMKKRDWPTFRWILPSYRSGISSPGRVRRWSTATWMPR